LTKLDSALTALSLCRPNDSAIFLKCVEWGCGR